ncbi:hypothetical protein FWF93_01390 [Candidatus Saccharibacteria bacterium]|jgi:DNA polymerase III delta prime subunit|nr:hypothetical protein [Candidatus Saccharibacteria bacterium]
MFKLAQSTILAGGDIDGLLARAREIAHKIDGDYILIEHQDKSDKVKEIRELYRFARGVHRQPLVFILQADSFFATVGNDHWQNAFLKLFEEPNPNIYFIIATTAPHKLLPTIKSRGQVIKHGEHITQPENSTWFTLPTYDRLKIVAKIKSREEAIELVQSMAANATKDSSRAKNLPLLSDTLDRLAQNGNVKIQLTNLAVNL